MSMEIEIATLLRAGVVFPWSGQFLRRRVSKPPAIANYPQDEPQRPDILSVRETPPDGFPGSMAGTRSFGALRG